MDEHAASSKKVPDSHATDNSLSTVEAPPRASILIESMRDIGYSLETALGDVIDNSITAAATSIHIHVDATPTVEKIAIVDNGRGMTADELIDAMRLGSRHPSEKRNERDLGRFGLGLKTASFSQCRRLTVVARKSGITSAAIWDLDHVAREDRWSLQIPERWTGIPYIEHLESDGALVLWEKLDRAVEQGSDSSRLHFIRRLDETRKHLELIFHRFLASETGVPRVQILLNDLPLKPFDPFHSNCTATTRGQTEKVPLGDEFVEITPFTLPHHRNVSLQDWERYAGEGGYLKNQGFYLYREKRLILHGTWFGLARQTELTKLARVRIDMPNGLDAEWQVDVKKAWARPPLPIRQRLERIIEAIGAPSRRIYTARGRRINDVRLPIWQRVQENNAIVYKLNPENPLVADFATRLPTELGNDFDRLIKVIGAALPMDALLADLASSPETVANETLDAASLRSVINLTYAGLVAAGVSEEYIPRMMRIAEPFRSQWDLVETMMPNGGQDQGS
jgi:hypothetical protein